MAIPVNIDSLIHGKTIESNRIEYKAGFNPTPIVHTICAFANDIDNIGGGYIIIGIEQDSNGFPVFPVKGVEMEDIDEIMKGLHRVCHFIEPVYEPVVEPVEFEGKTLILIWVPGGKGRPYSAPKDTLDKKTNKYPYIRKFSSSILASEEEKKELYYISSSIPFDDRECYPADISDLDLGEMREFLQMVDSRLYQNSLDMDKEELARSMHLLAGPPEAVKPINAAVLLFGKQPETIFPYSYIEVVHKSDPAGRVMEERKFTGPIYRQLMNSIKYIKDSTLTEKIRKQEGSEIAERIWNYPLQAVEEIVSNAIYHRDYASQNPVTITICPEYIEVTSFPGFHRSITDKDIENETFEASFYRNRRIGDFLKELGLIEGRNTGFPNARKSLLENGSPKLKIKMSPDRDYVCVRISIHPSFAPASSLSPYQEKILDLLRAQPSTLTELAASMGYKGITAKLRNNVAELKSRGYIVMIQSKDDHLKMAVQSF